MPSKAVETLADVDVFIAGYGPVGATIAWLLGEHGINTLVADKSDAIRVR
jgi:flavin-dependent dehydrogenase